MRQITENSFNMRLIKQNDKWKGLEIQCSRVKVALYKIELAKVGLQHRTPFLHPFAHIYLSGHAYSLGDGLCYATRGRFYADDKAIQRPEAALSGEAQEVESRYAALKVLSQNGIAHVCLYSLNNVPVQERQAADIRLIAGGKHDMIRL